MRLILLINLRLEPRAMPLRTENTGVGVPGGAGTDVQGGGIPGVVWWEAYREACTPTMVGREAYWAYTPPTHHGREAVCASYLSFSPFFGRIGGPEAYFVSLRINVKRRLRT